MISIGIDVSKGKSMVCGLKPYGEIVISPFEIKHERNDVEKLIKTIKELEDEVKVIIESTGHYHLQMVEPLIEAKIFVVVENPIVISKYIKMGIRKNKTDRSDSVKIAEYGLSMWYSLQKINIPKDIYKELKFLSRQYYHHTNLKVISSINFTNLLDKVMPKIKKKLHETKLLAFVEKYIHYDNITKKSKKQFYRSYFLWCKKEGFRYSEAKANSIYALAQSGIPTLNSKYTSTKMLILESIKSIQQIEMTRNNILSQMKDLAMKLEEYEVVRNMNGVGDKLAVRLIAEIGDITRFKNKKSLIAYAGIDAPSYESGSFVGTNRRISKRGSKHLRKTGFEIMSCLKIHKPSTDNEVYIFIIKKELEGKAKKQAKIAGLNKFLRIYYARVSELYN